MCRRSDDPILYDYTREDKIWVVIVNVIRRQKVNVYSGICISMCVQEVIVFGENNIYALWVYIHIFIYLYMTMCVFVTQRYLHYYFYFCTTIE